MFDSELISSIVTSTLRSSIPLLLAALGGTFSIRAGVSELGLEGMMLGGSFFAVVGSYVTGNAWGGLLFGVVFGIVFSMLHAVMHITYRVNASISGMAVNLLATALTPLLLLEIFDSTGNSPLVESFTRLNGTWISRIPILGPMLGTQNILFFIAIALVIVSYIFIFKSKMGLRMRMVGENPEAASTVGLNVKGYKYFGVAMSGALSGFAGAYLSIGQLNLFVENMTAGRGYMAVVINAFGRFNPLGALAGSIFFGFFDALQTVFQDKFPSQLVMMSPYVVTLLVIILGVAGARGPAGVGKHVDK